MRALNRLPSRETHCGSNRFIHLSKPRPTAKNASIETRFKKLLATPTSLAPDSMFHDVVVFLGFLVVTLGLSLKFVALSLLLLAGGLAGATIWFWFTARPEPESLAPLEVMSGRDFLEADEDARKQMLNSVRAIPVITPPVVPTSANETK